ncbi:hypothetical protein EYF80_009405 [Liparis tanakae]|uniref:Uncharacterized protein n=1 Tax=Liparis tanakae TaxID=230148 RepID=A0A4Z2IRC3_9TELE|nr:hypothetical protein EYF80_009405 [Liparis tanakae]
MTSFQFNLCFSSSGFNPSCGSDPSSGLTSLVHQWLVIGGGTAGPEASRTAKLLSLGFLAGPEAVAFVLEAEPLEDASVRPKSPSPPCPQLEPGPAKPEVVQSNWSGELLEPPASDSTSMSSLHAPRWSSRPMPSAWRVSTVPSDSVPSQLSPSPDLDPRREGEPPSLPGPNPPAAWISSMKSSRRIRDLVELGGQLLNGFGGGVGFLLVGPLQRLLLLRAQHHSGLLQVLLPRALGALDVVGPH